MEDRNSPSLSSSQSTKTSESSSPLPVTASPAPSPNLPQRHLSDEIVTTRPNVYSYASATSSSNVGVASIPNPSVSPTVAGNTVDNNNSSSNNNTNNNNNNNDNNNSNLSQSATTLPQVPVTQASGVTKLQGSAFEV